MASMLAMRRVSILGGDGEIEIHPGFLVLRNRRPAQALAEVDEVIKKLELELERLKTPRLIIDTSQCTEVSSDSVRLRLGDWLNRRTDLGRIGWVVTKEMHQIAVNMSSVSRGARARAFLTVEDAWKWMQEAQPKR